MFIRHFVLLSICGVMIGCGGSQNNKAPTAAELKAMDEKMQKDMMSMPKLPSKVGNANDPMKGMGGMMNTNPPKK
ncbi:MAG: hypothetical protein WCH39_06685 [Schlesneria sp.]